MKQNDNKITIFDVAKVAGVSKSTVSLVLQQSPKVAEKTRHIVWDALRQTGYVPNAAARNLVEGKTRVIGLATEVFNPKLTERIYFSSTIGALLENLRSKQYHLMIYNASLPLQRSMDGMLMLSLNMKHPLVDQVRQARLPYAMLNRRIDDPVIPYVSHDFTTGGYMATQHLLSIGHRRIGFMTGILTAPPHLERLIGYEKALNEVIPDEDAKIIFEARDTTPESGYRGTEVILKTPQKPTALFVSNYEMLPGVIEYCRLHNIRIPEDLSIISYDDPWAFTALIPPITAIRPKSEALGAKSADLILQLAEGHTPSKIQVLIKPNLIVRRSTQSVSNR